MEQPPQVQWARTADVSWPIKWGEVEDAILDLKLPPSEREREGVVVRALARTVLRALTVLALLSPVIGFALSWRGARAEFSFEAEDWWSGATFAFLIALALVGATANIWWDEGRRRGPLGLAFSGITGVLALAAFVVVVRTGEEVGFWTQLIMLATAALGLGVFGAVLVASAPSAGVRGRRRLLGPAGTFNIDPLQQARYADAREQVLDVLGERGLARLEPGQREEMLAMDLGSWHQLDSRS